MNQRSSSSRARQPRKDRLSRDVKSEDLRSKKEGLSDGTSTPTIPRKAESSSEGFGLSRRREFRDRSLEYREKRSASRDDDKGKISKRHERDGSAVGSSRRGEIPTAKILQSEALTGTGNSLGLSIDSKRADRGHCFTDDTRLSKLVRRIIREDERDRRAAAARQLRDFLLLPENNKIIMKMSDHLLAVFQDILHERIAIEVKKEIAHVIGAVGAIMGYEAKRYFQWLFSKYLDASSDDIRIMYQLALLESLKLDEEKLSLREFIPMVMTNIQTALENADTPEVLVAIVDVILFISAIYPLVFSSHFRDTVDILVGWHIDSTQKESLTQYASEALISFHPQWVSDINFSITLLGQFAEDMEAYAEDLNLMISGQVSPDEELPSPQECITKITALLRVFTTVVKSLGDYFYPIRGPPITWEYITENLVRILKSVQVANTALPSEKMLTLANDCISLLVTHLQSHTTQSSEHLLPFIVIQSGSKWLGSRKYVLSLLNLLQKVIEIKVPVEFIGQIMGPDAVLTKLRFTVTKEVNCHLLTVYHTILALKNVPLVEEAYRYILGDLEIGFNNLMEKAASDQKCTLVTSNPFEAMQYSTFESEAMIMFGLCALTEISNSKNSIIGMWALKPNLFELFSQELHVSNSHLAHHFPGIQYSVLSTLYFHCTRHGNFISSSNVLNPGGGSESSLIASVSPTTSGYFSRILNLIAEVLSTVTISYDVRLLCLTWVHDILGALLSITNHLVWQSSEIAALTDSVVIQAFNQDKNVCHLACKCLHHFMKRASLFSQQLLRRCLEVCLLRLVNNTPNICKNFMTLVKLLPIDITTSSVSIYPERGTPLLNKKITSCSLSVINSIQTTWLAHRSHMVRPPAGTFHSHNFRSVMGYILNNLKPSQFNSRDWLERIFHSSQRPSRITFSDQLRAEDNLLAQLGDGNDCMLWFWCTWEAAQFCVLAKLRTPLGKPQDTFTTIEGAIKAYATSARNREHDEIMPKISIADGENHPWFAQQLRVKLLLDFMEHLEKLMHNAYDGCAVAMTSAPKAVRTFFRTNKGTCMEWLGRVRSAVITVAIQSGQPAIAIRQAFDLLKEFKDTHSVSGCEFEHVIVWLIQSLIELHSPDAILGVYYWCREVFNRKLPWVKAAAEMANRRYEIAVVEFIGALNTYTLSGLTQDSDETSKSINSPAESPPTSPKLQPPDGIRKKTIFTKPSELDPVVANFIVSQITECYVHLNDWLEIQMWSDKLQQMKTEHNGGPMQKAFSANMDLNYIKALAKFDDWQYDEVKGHLDLVPNASVDDLGISSLKIGLVWDAKQLLDVAEKQLLRSATAYVISSDIEHDLPKITDCLEQTANLTASPLFVSSMDWPPKLIPKVTMVHHWANALSTFFNNDEHKGPSIPLSQHLKLDPHNHDSSVLNQAIRWTKFQLHLLHDDENDEQLQEQLSQLQLAAAHIARKSHNFKLSNRLIVDQIQRVLEQDDDSLPSLISAVRSLLAAPSSSTLLTMKVYREAAKLLYSIGQTKESFEVLTKSIDEGVQILTGNLVGISKDQINLCSELNARSILSFVKWLQVDQKQLNQLMSQTKLCDQGDDGISIVAKTVRSLIEMEELDDKIKWHNNNKNRDLLLEDFNIKPNLVIGEADALLGQLMHLGTLQAPNLAKSWSAFATWCYKWGRKSVDNASHGSVELLAEEEERILALLPKGVKSDESETVLTVLSKIHGEMDDEDIGVQNQSLYEDVAEVTKRQLLSSCPSLQAVSDECIGALIDVWRDVLKRVYLYYELSAKAYFTYLKLTGEDSEHSKQVNEDGNITATLRLLRFVVKHASELRDVLEDGLAHTPTAPWKGIIPQLFSRLNHPESYVRQSVLDLLCRVAQDAPHLIVYPAVVGCSSVQSEGKVHSEDGLLSDYLSQTYEEGLEDNPEEHSQPDEEASNAGGDDVNKAMLQNCFTAIVDTLAHHNSRMISEVKLLVQELRRITLLWDELWLGTLNQHHTDVSRRIIQLENEVKKVTLNLNLTKEEKSAIIREKHNAVLRPTLYVMENLKAITLQTAETPHEKWFQETYGKVIEEAVHRLKNPPNPANPQASWQQFKQLHHALQQRAQKRSSLTLTMDQISPKLSNLKATVIAMPGISSKTKQVVTIESVHNNLSILPTKTKPKKLAIFGSDGKRYAYLFKGLEDLHLDERIMQFLTIVNNMFAKSNKHGLVPYHARHYSVTPLGSRSGLIQWVDGATPLFGLYKRWQQREALAQTLKNQTTNATGNPSIPNPSILRPSDIFYNKLTPALKEKGITNLENRKEWPLAILRSVLLELMSETPKDLLAKEIWCSCSSAGEWWTCTQMYARSTAVMSMIGYIIGLGDRHLDNVLIDLSTGEVVHIDYNVCFEKGKNLRVPEKVPFRMTPNIQTALGTTGVEGIFQISCEHVLKTMRKGRETLLTLLEAFVYDPLVDWTTGNEGGYTGAFYGGGQNIGPDTHQSKRELEREITQSMFSIRVLEMKVVWLKNRDDMLAALPKLQEVLTDWTKAQMELQKAQNVLDSLTDQKTLLDEAKTDANHALYSLQQRYQEYAIVKAAQKTTLDSIQEKLTECEHGHNVHLAALHSIHGQKLAILRAELAKPLDLNLPCFATATNFLQTAGQGHTVQQCEQVENELSNLLHQRRTILRNCIDVLTTYANIVTQFPPHFVEHNRCYRWQHWLQNLLDNFSLETCRDIISQFHVEYGLESMTLPNIQLAMATHVKLQNIIAETNARLVKLYERRNLDVMETSMLSVAVKDTRVNIQHFVEDNGESGIVSLACVVVTALCTLTKRYLVMEGAAAAAGDRLMDLTSRDGDWFLDELCSMSGNVLQLIDLLREYPLPSVNMLTQQAIQVSWTAHNIYNGLQDLNVNFRNIILPEAIKTIQSEEPTVMAAIDGLDHIIKQAGIPLEHLVSQLEILIRNTIMGIEIIDRESVITVHKLQARFEALLQGPDPELTDLTAGQMLLMGFNGLFTKLDNDFRDVLHNMDKVNVSSIWKKVDIVREAKALQTLGAGEATLNLISEVFFVKRLQAMQDFFRMCRQFAKIFQGLEPSSPFANVSAVCYDDDQLSKPVKQFIAEYVRKQILGLPSQALGYALCILINNLGCNVTAEIELKDIGAECKVSIEDLCKKAVDHNLRSQVFLPTHLTQASGLTSSQDGAWRRQDLARRLDSNISMLKSSLHCTQLQLARFQWLKEDLLAQGGASLHTMVVPNHSTIMTETRKSVQTLLSIETSLANIQERCLTLESSIEQRLKWAAGANPSLSLILQEFEQSSEHRTALMTAERELSVEIANACNGILHLEALRTRTPESMACDNTFMSLINRCQESCMLMQSCPSSVSELEEILIQTIPLGDNETVTGKWLDSLYQQVSESIKNTQSQVSIGQAVRNNNRDTVKNHVSSIRTLLTQHHKLMSEVRSILKTLAKHEEQDLGEELVKDGVREYMVKYRAFSERFTRMLKEVMSEEISAAAIASVSTDIPKLTDQISYIYERLMCFAPPLKLNPDDPDSSQKSANFASVLRGQVVVTKTVEDDPGGTIGKKTHFNRAELFSSTPPASPSVAKIPVKKPGISRDPRTGKAIQERNSYAVSVWRRVKMKLDGRDPDVNKRSTVNEQVDFVIKEATNLDNLAVLYEGWTPWV